MASQILITMDDLETAVRLNAALEAAKFSTTMFSSLDDARGTVRSSSPRWRTTPRSPPLPCWSRPTPSAPSGWNGSGPPKS
jgi:hypothetical protein